MNSGIPPKLLGFRSLTTLFDPLFLLVLVLFVLVGSKETKAQDASTQEALAQDTVRVSEPNSVRYPTIRVPVSVLYGEAHVKGLSREDFRLFHDGEQVSSFKVDQYFDSYAWLAVALVIDQSGSMEGRPLAESKRAIDEFLQVLGRRDRAAIVSFDEKVRLRASFDASRAEVLTEAGEIAAGGDTALRDAIMRADERLNDIDAPRRAIVVLTDGRDTASETSSEEVLRALGEANWRCFTVGLGSEINASFLRQIADAGDGSFFRTPSPEDLAGVYRRVARELESRYLLTYRPPGAVEERSSRLAEARRHDLRVVVDADDWRLEGQRAFTTGGQTSNQVSIKSAPRDPASIQQGNQDDWSLRVAGWKATGMLFIGGLFGATVGTGLLLLLGLSVGRRPAVGGSVIGLSGLLGGLLTATALLVS